VVVVVEFLLALQHHRCCHSMVVVVLLVLPWRDVGVAMVWGLGLLWHGDCWGCRGMVVVGVVLLQHGGC